MHACRAVHKPPRTGKRNEMSNHSLSDVFTVMPTNFDEQFNLPILLHEAKKKTSDQKIYILYILFNPVIVSLTSLITST